MIKKYLTISLLLAAGSALCGLDVSNWKDISGDNSAGANQIENSGFEEGSIGWELNPELAQIGLHGENGNQGLRLTWDKTDVSPIAARHKLTLKPDRNYTLQARVRTISLEGANNSKVRMQLNSTEPDANGRHFRNATAIYKGRPNAWRTQQIRINTSGAASEVPAELVLFFAENSHGVMDFDDFSMVEDAPVWQTSLLVPHRTWVDATGEPLTFVSFANGFNYPGSETADLQCLVTLTTATGQALQFVAPVRDNRFQLEPGALPEGDARLELTLVDAANQLILARETLSLPVRQRPESLAVEVDSYGRTLVNGEPFLPLGIYGTHMDDRALEILKGSPFNTFLPYASLSMAAKGSDRTGIEAIREVLDKAHAQDLKVIFSVKNMYPNIRFSTTEWNGLTDREQIMDALISGLRDHPALLSWYTVDELPIRFAPQIRHWREKINAADPGHPVLGVYHKPNELGPLAPGHDIIGVDPYPIDNDESRDMELVLRHLNDARTFLADGNGNASLYLVPQIYNKGVLSANTANDLEAYRRLYRDPTEHEMLSMCVLGGIYKVRGFLFYSLQDVLLRGPDKEQFARRWPEIYRVALQLRDLEPFLLSAEPDPQISVDVRQGKVEARAITTENGRKALLIAAIGPGEAEAFITFPGVAGLSSLTGKTTTAGSDVYHFKGQDISSDILR